MTKQHNATGLSWLAILGSVAAITACGGGAATPPAAQAQAQAQTTEQTGGETTTNAEPTSNTDTSTDNTSTPGVSLPQTEGQNETAETPEVTVDVSEPVLCSTEEQRFAEVFLALVNAARAESRLCGEESFASVPALTWSNKLQRAAEAHSLDMSDHNFFSHTGSDGSDVAMRAQAQVYEWRAVGENIAAGQDNLQEVIVGWLGSPGHCRNLMNSNYTEVGAACVSNENADYLNYWTNVLGDPLR